IHHAVEPADDLMLASSSRERRGGHGDGRHSHALDGNKWHQDLVANGPKHDPSESLRVGDHNRNFIGRAVGESPKTRLRKVAEHFPGRGIGAKMTSRNDRRWKGSIRPVALPLAF